MRKGNLYKDLAWCYEFITSGKEHKQEAEFIKKIVKQYKKSKGNALLDVGCGHGWHDKFLKKNLGEFQDLILLVIREDDKINGFLQKGRSQSKKTDSEKLDIMIHHFLTPSTASIFTNYFERCKSEGDLKRELDPEICSMMVEL